jgi:hypothetical protein
MKLLSNQYWVMDGELKTFCRLNISASHLFYKFK